MSQDKAERRHRHTTANRKAVETITGANFNDHLSLAAAMGLLRCIHGEQFPCRQCIANRRWNEAASRKKLTDAEFEAQYAKETP